MLCTALFTAYAVPAASALWNPEALPVGLHVAPGCALDPPAPRVQNRAALQCSACNSFANLYGVVNAQDGTYTCNFCQATSALALPRLMASALADSASFSSLGWPEFDAKRYELQRDLISTDAEFLASVPPPVLVLVLDELADATCLAALAAELPVALEQNVGGQTLVALITFGAAVSMYELVDAELVSADTMRVTNFPLPAEQASAVSGSLGTCLVPLARALAPLRAALQALSEAAAGRPAAEYEPLRSLGSALGVALTLARTALAADGASRPLAIGSRIMLLTSGPCNDGFAAFAGECANANAPDCYATLGECAAQLGLIADVLCWLAREPRDSGMDIIQPFVRATGGQIVVMQEASATGEDAAPSWAGALLSLLRPSRCFGSQARLTVTTSAPVSVVQVIGAVSEVADQPLGSDRVSSLSMQLHGFGADSSVSLVLQAACDLDEATGEAAHVHIQCVIEWTELVERGANVLSPGSYVRLVRVVTRRLPVTSELGLFLNSIDLDAVSVMLAKRALLLLLRDAFGTQGRESLDGALLGMARAFCPAAAAACASSASAAVRLSARGGLGDTFREQCFPLELVGLLARMYHARRSLALQPADESGDSAALARSLAETTCARIRLLNLPYQSAALTLSTRVRVYPGAHDAAPVSLVLQSASVVAVAALQRVFVWVGARASSDAALVAQAWADASAVLAPECGWVPVRLVAEGSPDEASVLRLLAPVHRDSARDNATDWGELAGDAVRARLLAVRAGTGAEDELSMRAYQALLLDMLLEA